LKTQLTFQYPASAAHIMLTLDILELLIQVSGVIVIKQELKGGAN